MAFNESEFDFLLSPYRLIGYIEGCLMASVSDYAKLEEIAIKINDFNVANRNYEKRQNTGQTLKRLSDCE